MPKLVLLTDLTPNFPALFSFFRARAQEIAGRGWSIPLPCRWNSGQMFAHQPFWESVEIVGTPSNIPLARHGWLQNILSLAEAQANILLYARVVNSTQQEAFLSFLKAQQGLAAYDIHCLAIVGRPACYFEQSVRLAWPSKLPQPLSYSLAQDCTQFVELINIWHKELGKHNVKLFIDASVSATSTGLSAGHKAALAELGLLSLEPPESPHFLNLRSREARHLLLLSEVRYNAWPAMDVPLLVSVLKDLEERKSWDMRPISQPKYRAVLKRSELRFLDHLAAILGVTGESLACPEELAPERPWQDYEQIADEVIKTFVQALPESLVKSLSQRYKQDNLLLRRGHQKIYAELASLQPKPVQISQVSPEPLLSILTLTRNQEKYIGECIESVLAQKTNFPVQHIIVDHFSDDQTPDIVQKYAEKYPTIRPVLLSRRMKGLSVRALFSRCRTKYAAICDGDDYFTDPYKLQKQLNFLEKYPDCTLCFHPVDVIYEDGSPSRVYPPEELLPKGARNFFTLKDLLFANLIQTNSVMYRWRFRDGLPDWFAANLVPGDWYWHLLHAELGPVGYLSERMSVYRRHAASLYAPSEINHVIHRKIHGLNELRTYDVCNKHFQGRHFDDFSRLATGVLADFVQIYMETGDDTLLAKAAEISPEFTHNFLKQIQKS